MGHLGGLQSRYNGDWEFLSGTNAYSSQMTFKGKFVHGFWAFGEWIKNWYGKWQNDMVLCIFKGEWMI